MADSQTIYVAPWGDDSLGSGTESAPVATIAKAIQIIDDDTGNGEIILLTTAAQYEFSMTAGLLSYLIRTEGERLAKVTLSGTSTLEIVGDIKRVHFVWAESGGMVITGIGTVYNSIFDIHRTFSSYGGNNLLMGSVVFQHCVFKVTVTGSGSFEFIYKETASVDLSMINSILLKGSGSESWSLGSYDQYGGKESSFIFLNCYFDEDIAQITDKGFVYTNCLSGSENFTVNYQLTDGSPLIDAGYAASSADYDPDAGDGARALWPSLGFVSPDIGIWGGPERLDMARAENVGTGGPLPSADGTLLVYDQSRNIWLSFTGFNIVTGHALNYGNIDDNLLLMLTDDGKLKKYPGDEISSDFAEVETGSINARGTVIIRQISGDFEKDSNVTMVLVNEGDDGDRLTFFENATRNNWNRVKYETSRGARFSVRILNALRLFGVKIDLKARDTK